MFVMSGAYTQEAAADIELKLLSGEAEVLRTPQVMHVNTGGGQELGQLIITNFRLVFIPDDIDDIGDDDLNTLNTMTEDVGALLNDADDAQFTSSRIEIPLSIISQVSKAGALQESAGVQKGKLKQIALSMKTIVVNSDIGAKMATKFGTADIRFLHIRCKNMMVLQ